MTDDTVWDKRPLLRLNAYFHISDVFTVVVANIKLLQKQERFISKSHYERAQV